MSSYGMPRQVSILDLVAGIGSQRLRVHVRQAGDGQLPVQLCPMPKTPRCLDAQKDVHMQ